MNDCLFAHKKHEWISESEGMVWIFLSRDNSVDFDIFQQDKVENLPQQLSALGSDWRYLKEDEYFTNHCNIYHPDNTFKVHVNLYSENNPNHRVALINPQNHAEFILLGAKEYQAEDYWYSQKEYGTEIDKLFAQAKRQYSDNSNKTNKLTSQNYTNYESQMKDGNVPMVLALIGAIIGTIFLFFMIYHI